MVLCPCGHTMDAHDRVGCSGDRRFACACERDRYAALQAATSAARRKHSSTIPVAEDPERVG